MSSQSLDDEYSLHAPAGSVVYSQGDPAASLYVVRSGRVRITRETYGTMRVIRDHEAGEAFGAVAIFSGLSRRENAVVLLDAKLLRIPVEDLERITREGGELAVRLLKQVARELADQQQLIDTLIDTRDEARVALALTSWLNEALGLNRPREKHVGGSARDTALVPTTTSNELALRLGMREPRVRRVLEHLARASIVEFAGATLQVIDIAALQDFYARLGEEGAAA